jgi:putative transposase
MPHTYAQNMVHVVFSTKDRRNTIPADFRPQLWAYAGGVCQNLGVLIHAIGGTRDHIHFLLQIPPAVSLAKAVLAIKTNSSRWAREQGHGFSWQEGYGAFSVSSSVLPTVRRYIQTQEAHHKKMTFDEEFIALLRKHGIEFDPKFVFG